MCFVTGRKGQLWQGIELLPCCAHMCTLQGVSVPLAWEQEGPAALNRYAAQLHGIGAKVRPG